MTFIPAEVLGFGSEPSVADLQNRLEKSMKWRMETQARAWDAERRLEVLTEALRTIVTYVAENPRADDGDVA